MLKKKVLSLSVLSLALAGALTGCGTKEESKKEEHAAHKEEKKAESVTIKHAWGETKFDKAPQKIVTLDFSFIDTLTALEVKPAGNAGVGETKVPEYLASEVGEVTDVGERKSPNLEVLSSVKPDLIIASADRHSMIQNELKGIAPVIALDDNSYDEVMSNVDTIAKVLGKEKDAEAAKEALQKKIDDTKAKVKGEPSVLVVGSFEDEFSVWIKDSFIGSLMTNVGAKYAFEGEKESTEGKAEIATITMERLAEINPDYIFLYGEDTAKFKNNPLYGSLKAVKDKHVVEVDRNLWSRGRGPVAAEKVLDEAGAVLTGEKTE
ncbi:ABC transporter substrate-binding protein [Fictibacillus iocasae]|uniref:ABC transporter substrate-binding protein n=1 Tax=Fictibacillus iocasae TaxID=2715437 RepID=A0ABW2NQR7_9BACL